MADVFGNPKLFGEFEKDRSHTDDHSKRCSLEGARAYLSTLCSPVKHKTLATEKELLLSGDTQTDFAIDRDSIPDIASAMEYIRNLESEIKKLKEINDKLLLENGPFNPKSLQTSVDGPAVQVLFMNNAAARKCRSKVENCLKDIFSQNTEEFFRESTMPCTSEAIGSYRYFKEFILDASGWPLPDQSSAMTDGWNLPKYEQVFRQSLPCELIKEKEVPEVIIKEKRAKAACFNCGGDHNVLACKEKKDPQRINSARRQFMDKFLPSGAIPGKQRYHIEADPRFSEMKPGTISDVLREALGISTQQLPPYIYQMRILGYPPGHLENARQSTSGLTMFDKHGQELTTDGELLEDGEVNDAFARSPEYNFDKLVDYPGFNVSVPAGTIDESQRLGMPPMQQKMSKNAMKDFLFTKQMADSAKRKLDDLNCGDGSRKRVKTDVDLQTTFDMDIEETTGVEVAGQFLPSPWPIVSMPTINMYPPPPPPPLPADVEEELPPLPVDPSPGGSPAVLFEICAEQSETTSEVETGARSTSLQTTKTVTPVGGRSRSFCFGTPLALSNDDDDDSPCDKSLPDASKFASGISGLILHDNLPNATGTFNKLKIVLADVKNKSNPSTNALLKR